MTLCATINDTHLGARGDSLIFHKYMARFYNEIFFPTLAARGVNHIFHLGDLFDRRKYINYVTLHQGKKYFFDNLRKYGMTMDVAVGNHDTSFKNTNSINSPDLLLQEYADCITVYNNTTEIERFGVKVLMVPWLCAENFDESIELINSTKAQILLGHLEIKGFQMYRGHPGNEGMPAAVFNRFDLVCSGHFHHKSTKGNINYLGAPYEMTWQDYNDERGFHLLDLGKRELEYIKNPITIFERIHYDDSHNIAETIMNIDYSKYKDKYVKVIVREKNNPFWFDNFIEDLEKAGVIDLQVVDDHFNKALETDEDIIDEAQDTPTILRKYIEQIPTSTDKEKLTTLINQLYHDAMALENQ